MTDELREILELLNPWWKSNDVDAELAKHYKRPVFNKIVELEAYRQITILAGLRRVGKTTLLYQAIQKRIRNIKPENVLYFSLDRKVENLALIIRTYSDFVNIDFRRERVYIFLDEITKLSDWANQIKVFYDSQPNIKFCISSSSSINLEEEAIKNLAGRYFLINIMPLSFKEYLELTGKEKMLKSTNLYDNEIRKEFGRYLMRTFPEIVQWKNELLIKDYLRTTIIDKIARSDLPERFKNLNKELIYTLVEMFYSEPGIILDYDGISRKLGISKKTLVKHIFYLEFSYLIRRVRNFRPSVFASTRKMQRVYPYWWSLSYCYGSNFDRIMENMVGSILNAKYYWRDGNKEVDFLDVRLKEVTPIEVKNRDSVSRDNLKNMWYFLGKYSKRKGIVVYNGKEEEIVSGKAKVKLVPVWRWLLNQGI